MVDDFSKANLSHNKEICLYCQKLSDILAKPKSFYTGGPVMSITKPNDSNIKPKKFGKYWFWLNNASRTVTMEIETDQGFYKWKWTEEFLTKVGVTVADLEWAVAKADLDYKKLEGMLYNLNLQYAKTKEAVEKTSDAFKAYQYDNILNTDLGTQEVTHSSFSSLSRQLPAMEKIVQCPEEGCKHNVNLWSTVQHLNDNHKWTREAIADWIDLLPFNTSFVSKDPDRA